MGAQESPIRTGRSSSSSANAGADSRLRDSPAGEGLPVTSFATYVTDRAAQSPEHLDARNFLLALRGERLRGESSVPVGERARPLHNANADDAIDWFGQMAAAFLESRAIAGPVALLPVPTSRATIDDAPPWTSFLAIAVLANGPYDGELLDALRWKEALPPGEPARTVAALYDNLVLIRPIPPGRRIVLVDYLYTSPNVLRAVAARLSRAGASVVRAICAGRTARRSSLGAFRIATTDHPRFEPGH